MKRGVALLLLAMTSCGTPPPGRDPCEPGGHVHRDPSGDWCHCDRGYRASANGLSCEVDPAFTGRTTIDLGASDERACWHASRGPFATRTDGSRIDDFLTLYTLALPARADGLRGASVRYRAAVSAPHVLSASRGVNVSIEEVDASGAARPVKVLVTRATTRCAEMSQQFGFELVNRVEYQFVFGPSMQEQVSFLLDQVE